MPKHIKLDIYDLTEKEKKELLNKNIKEIKFINKTKEDDLIR